MPPRPTGPARRPVAALVGALLGVGLVVGGCGGQGSSAARPRTPGSATGGPSGTATIDASIVPPGGSASASSTPRAVPTPDPGFGMPSIGQCSQMTELQSRASVAAPGTRATCRKPHSTTVVYAGYTRRPLTPLTPVATRRTVARRVCEPAYRAFVGGTAADRATSILTWTMFTPGQAQLVRGARWVRCDVLARSGTTLVPLPDVTPLLRSGVPEQLRVCQSEQGQDVSCAVPHAYRVEAVFPATGPTYPGTTSALVRDRCRQLMGAYGGFFQLPSRLGWEAGDRYVRCLGPVQPPAATTP
jgi:hypothetical protein